MSKNIFIYIPVGHFNYLILLDGVDIYSLNCMINIKLSTTIEVSSNEERWFEFIVYKVNLAFVLLGRC